MPLAVTVRLMDNGQNQDVRDEEEITKVYKLKCKERNRASPVKVFYIVLMGFYIVQYQYS